MMEICSKIKVSPKFIQLQLWDILGEFEDIYTWHKGELGIRALGKHSIDADGLPSCRMTLDFLFEKELKLILIYMH